MKVNRRLVAVAAGLVAAVGLGAGVAWASIPGPDGVIHACYKTSAPLQGDTLIIDSAAACPSGYTSLNWNQAGPAGATGATGATGAQGPSGVVGSYSRSVSGSSQGAGETTGTISCDSGDIASGIGWRFPTLNARMFDVHPTSDNTWAWEVAHDSAQSWTVYVKCLDTNAP